MYLKAICEACGNDRYIVNKKYKLCATCNKTRLNKGVLPKPKPIKKVSNKQKLINNEYYTMLKEYDKEVPKICTGCKTTTKHLTHSHIISRADCISYGRPDLYSDKNNLRYHCLDCHTLWESKKRYVLLDYKKNIEYVRKMIPELLRKYKIDNI